MDFMWIIVIFLIAVTAVLLFLYKSRQKQGYEQGYNAARIEFEELIRASNNEKNELRTRLAVISERNEDIPKLNEQIKHQQEIILNNSAKISALEKELEQEKKSFEEKLDVVNKAEEKFREAFSALSKTALESNNENFIQSARALFEQYSRNFESNFDHRKQEIENFVNPLKDRLSEFDTFIKELERNRNTAYGELKEQVGSLYNSQLALQKETQNLVSALRKPQVRGRWGELQLRRVVEMAGMTNYCDFYEQETTTTDNDKKQRPDMIVRLPNNRNIAVDSKVPLLAYLEAIETEDINQKEQLLANHARQLKEHLKKLSAKSYYQDIQPAPEFVVCFLPGEIYFYAALEKDPTLIEYGVENNVIISTPTTLISLLKAVAYGWKQEQMAENAKNISDLAKELYSRINTFSEHLSKIGDGLDTAAKNYNRAVASFESRVLVQARKFNEFGIDKGSEIKEINQIETGIRQLKQ